MKVEATIQREWRWLRAAMWFVGIGVALYLGGMVWAGWSEVLAGVARIGFFSIALGAGVASCSYLLRFARWAFCLKKLGYHVPLGRNLLVYLAGLALTTSPGKLGETLRSLLLLPYGVRARDSLGAFLADRASDVLGVCLLGGLAAVARGEMAGVLWASLCVLMVATLALRVLVLSRGGRALDRIRDHRWRWLRIGPEALLAWAALWRPLRMVGFIMCACAAYGLQALVFHAFCLMAGVPVSLTDSVRVFAWATLFGAASMVPGGLGAMEAALVLQLVGLGAGEPVAVSVAIATRVATLWTGVCLGMFAVFAANDRSGLRQTWQVSEQ